MANFNEAVKKTLIHEGGFVNNKFDSGGPTKYGVTQKDMPDVDISQITPEQAAAYYSEHYWKPLYAQIESQIVAEKIFDMGVLFGVGKAVKILQAVLQPAFPEVTTDGQFGPTTLNAVNQAEENSLLQGYKTALVAYTLRIVLAHPEDRDFVAGWGRRINS